MSIFDGTQVVPAPEETSDRWTYPPFSGHYDSEYIWGRGSEDDKSNVIAIGLVQIPTVTYDEMGLLGEDARWQVFEKLPKFFERTFPRM